jgi:IPT/TIG domain
MAVSSGSAKVSSARGSAVELSAPRPVGGALSVSPFAPPVQSGSFAGYATFTTGQTTVSTTFRVPHINCLAGDSGIFPGAVVFAGPTSSETANGGFVIDQCSGGSAFVTAGDFISGVEENFANVVKTGDTIEVDVSVGGGGTSVTVKDLTLARAFTVTRTGADSAPDAELIATGGSTSLNGTPLPTATAATKYTNSTVNGSAIGTQSPSKVVLVNGCAVVLQPGAIDAATKMIFSVVAPKVDITNLAPSSATTGTSIEIDGFGFNSTSTVKFGAVAATTVSHDSATVLHATVPNTAVTGPVTVKNTAAPVGSITSACTFSVAPKIDSFTPASGITGSTVTINGSGLRPGPVVKFGTKRATVTSQTPTQLKVTVPSGDTTPSTISVTTPAGSASTASSFTPTLGITNFNPTSGPTGTTVTINGVGFNSTSAVKFNGVAATTVTHTSSTVLKAKVPTTATSGPITVTNTAAPVGTVSSATSYTVTPHIAPTVTSFTPTSGPVGTSVTITGTNFSGANSVKFGGVAATTRHVDSATQITATVPAGAVTGPISVTTAAGTGTSSTSFTVS